ncbi:hypothetical protein [Tranquillimonas alkanivorans]|uniref:Uncharacterized protein n=1 Tax=Tranquillimonas alkanivorans TaxID=441119 RepID=A0A1I5NQY3_9RHOB|nr:hypothetical protein [Tranquillimonas alkanivorans]SFP24239.1 hypothetical protein SAMN04488047_10439 [Tranquillimonas alkanivorans]
MAERKRSTDGTRETEEFTSDTPTPEHSGRAGGELERKVGTRDEGKPEDYQGRPGATRVTKEDEDGEGNLGGHHGTGSEED